MSKSRKPVPLPPEPIWSLWLAKVNALPAVPASIALTAIVVVVMVLSSDLFNQPLPVADEGGPNITVAQSPGLVDAERVCEFGNKQSREFHVVPAPPSPVYEYVSDLGADSLRWVDGGSDLALLNGEQVVLNEKVKECFRDSR